MHPSFKEDLVRHQELNRQDYDAQVEAWMANPENKKAWTRYQAEMTLYRTQLKAIHEAVEAEQEEEEEAEEQEEEEEEEQEEEDALKKPKRPAGYPKQVQNGFWRFSQVFRPHFDVSDCMFLGEARRDQGCQSRPALQPAAQAQGQDVQGVA